MQACVPAARCVRGVPLNSRPFQNQGAGNAGRPMRPAVSCAKSSAKTHTSIQVTPESPGIPHAMVYGLLRAHLGEPGFLPPSSPRSFRFLEFDTSVGVSGPHVFTVRFRRARQSHLPRPPHPRPAAATIANAPFVERDVGNIDHSCSFCKSESFFKSGLTGFGVICPSGKARTANANCA
jgi:hypothetical protein